MIYFFVGFFAAVFLGDAFLTAFGFFGVLGLVFFLAALGFFVAFFFGVFVFLSPDVFFDTAAVFFLGVFVFFSPDGFLATLVLSAATFSFSLNDPLAPFPFV